MLPRFDFDIDSLNVLHHDELCSVCTNPNKKSVCE